MLNSHLAKLLATFFYVGYFPKAPGSMATVVGFLIYAYLGKQTFLYVLLFLIITALGFWAADQMERVSGAKDPSCIVIDEISGVMIAFFFLPLSWPVIITTFFLFRAFDMFKIYPVYKLETLKGGMGVMMDDIVAGIYTCVTMHIAVRLAGIV